MYPDYDQKLCSFRCNYNTKGPALISIYRDQTNDNDDVVGMVKQKRMNVYEYYKTQTSGGGSNIDRKPQIETPNRNPKSKPQIEIPNRNP